MATRNRGTKAKGNPVRPGSDAARIQTLERRLAEEIEGRQTLQKELANLDFANGELRRGLNRVERHASRLQDQYTGLATVPYQTRRVVRTLVFEGRPEWVAHQLERSLEDGGHVISLKEGTLTVQTIEDRTTNMRPFEVRLPPGVGQPPRIPVKDQMVRTPDMLPNGGYGYGLGHTAGPVTGSGSAARTPTRDHELDAAAYVAKGVKDPHGPGTAGAPRFRTDRELEQRNTADGASGIERGVFPR